MTLAIVQRVGAAWRVSFYRRANGLTWPLYSVTGEWVDVAPELALLGGGGVDATRWAR